MNYVAIMFLVIVVFFLLANRKIIPYEEIVTNKDLKQKTEQVRKDIIYISRTNTDTLEKIELELKQNDLKYVVFGDIEDLNKEKLDVLVANFINVDKQTCGFGFQYEYVVKDKSLKSLIYKLLAACLNYIEMLSRQDKLNHSIIISEKSKIIQDIKKNNVVSFTLSPHFSRRVEIEDLKETLSKKHKISLRNIASIILTIISGTVVTANIVYNVISVIKLEGNIYDIIACIIIYICYANITVEIYKPIGIFRFVASYIFPIYIGVFLVVTTYYYIKKIMSRCKMGGKKELVISLLILFLVYLVFILIKK